MPHFFRDLPSLPELGATGAIDILVVAFVVYQCLMVVRGTRAAPILLGIVVIVCLYLVAVWAGLEALHSVLSLIVPYIGLAVLVLFQSESAARWRAWAGGGCLALPKGSTRPKWRMRS